MFSPGRVTSLFFIFEIYVFGHLFWGETNAGADHKRLLSSLFANYDVNERPVENESDAVTLKFGVTILSLVDVNIANGYMEANMWLSMEWNDFHLKWDSAEYGGIQTLSIPAARVWKPDVFLYNSVHEQFDPTYQTNVVIKEDGNVTYIPPGIHRTACQTDVRDYPYDAHNCSLKFGSWTWDGGKLDLTLNSETGGDLSSFIRHPEWELLGVPGVTNRVYYACCPDPYVDATFIVQIRRRGDAIFSGCSFALFLGTVSTLLSLFLPTNSGQRLTLGVVTLFGVLLMASSIHSSLGGKESIMVSFFRALSFIVFMSIISNVFILFFYNRNPNIHKMPNWFRNIFCELIPRFICLNRPMKTPSSQTGGVTGRNLGVAAGQVHDHYEDLVSDLQDLIQKVHGQETQSVNDWQYFAMVLDRLTFTFYTFFASLFFICLYAHY